MFESKISNPATDGLIAIYPMMSDAEAVAILTARPAAFLEWTSFRSKRMHRIRARS
ncbi:hypothetical protein [Yoonia sp. BS5-3]|uniref:Uncharacterized protein n=1 Tax=Yoonia phaeophyticola TaxID=3137369 RepID=A0ABZ2UZW2_9RHOB